MAGSTATETATGGHLSRYLMTRRIERAMAVLRRGDLSVTEVCFAVGCASLGTFSSRLTELGGVPPSTYRTGQESRSAGPEPRLA